jgi:hypothetical protein
LLCLAWPPGSLWPWPTGPVWPLLPGWRLFGWLRPIGTDGQAGLKTLVAARFKARAFGEAKGGLLGGGRASPAASGNANKGFYAIVSRFRRGRFEILSRFLHGFIAFFYAFFALFLFFS